MRRIDARLAIGFVLVVASIAGVYTLVGAADQTTAVFTASRPLAAGHQIEKGDFEVIHVRLAGATTLYVGADTLPERAVVVRSLHRGELVPAAAIGAARDITSTAVVLSLMTHLPVDAKPGAIVDVWSAPALGQGGFGPPTILVGRAEIARVIEAKGIGSAAMGINVEVIVPTSKIALLLQAQVNGDAISLVPTTGVGS